MFDPLSLIFGLGGLIFNGINAANANKAANQAATAYDTRQGEMDEINQRLAGTGMDQYSQLQGLVNQFGGSGLDQQIMGMLGNAIPGMSGALQGGANALGGLDFSALGRGLDSYRGPGFDKYHFGPVRDTLDQAVQGALDAGDRARVTAREQMALSNQGAVSGLDAALASRGISANSGVAASALGDLARSNATATGQLERGLADQAQGAALAGAQFDAQNAMGMAQLGSQYNLGFNQLKNDAALGGYNANLQRTGLLGDLLGQDMNRILAQTDLSTRAFTEPLSMAQGIYAQNYLAPLMEALGQQTGLANSLAGMGLSGLEGGTERLFGAAGEAGRGAGAAGANTFGFLGDMLGFGGGTNLFGGGLDWLGSLLGGGVGLNTAGLLNTIGTGYGQSYPGSG
jgi:hypothetical protein